MAVSCSSSSPLIIQNSLPIKKPDNKVLMVTNRQIPFKKAPPLQIRSSSRKKIFEDQSNGIICYRDGNGEITCEGYDEGPRLHRQLSTVIYHPREAEIVDLLQKNWLQIVRGSDLNCADKGDAGKKGFNWNGFNTSF